MTLLLRGNWPGSERGESRRPCANAVVISHQTLSQGSWTWTHHRGCGRRSVRDCHLLDSRRLARVCDTLDRSRDSAADVGGAVPLREDRHGQRHGIGRCAEELLLSLEAKHFYSVIAISTLVGMLINFAGINPMSALFWTAVINGLVSPPLLVVIMLVSNNKKVMGDKVNCIGTNIVGWVAAVGCSRQQSGCS